MKQSLILIIIAISIKIGFSCINYYHTVDQIGEMHSWGDESFVRFNKNFNLERISAKLPKLEANFQKYHSAYMLSDYAVLLMKAGKIEESLDLLIQLNKNLPYEYQIAANLGTAYELNGELDSALHYINRGIEINPDAHGGSEWVHIKILETKLKQIKGLTILDSTSVLGLSLQQKNDSLTREQLEIQIRERFPFSPGPDEIMASLMIDLGDCYANSLSIEYAKAFYNIAELYYGADSSITTPKIKEMISLRIAYSSISATEPLSDGSNTKVTGVPYKNIIDNNNSNNFSIDWSTINLNTEALLSQVDYSIDKNIVAEEQEVIIKNPAVEPRQNSRIRVSILIALIVFGTLTYFTIKNLSK